MHVQRMARIQAARRASSAVASVVGHRSGTSAAPRRWSSPSSPRCCSCSSSGSSTSASGSTRGTEPRTRHARVRGAAAVDPNQADIIATTKKAVDYLDPALLSITVTCSHGGAFATCGPESSWLDGDYVRVTVDYRYQFMTPLGSWSGWATSSPCTRPPSRGSRDDRPQAPPQAARRRRGRRRRHLRAGAGRALRRRRVRGRPLASVPPAPGAAERRGLRRARRRAGASRSRHGPGVHGRRRSAEGDPGNAPEIAPSQVAISFRCIVGDRDGNGAPDVEDIPARMRPGLRHVARGGVAHEARSFLACVQPVCRRQVQHDPRGHQQDRRLRVRARDRHQQRNHGGR